jgi:hypothetical protein
LIGVFFRKEVPALDRSTRDVIGEVAPFSQRAT